MFLVNWFYGVLSFLGLYNKSGKILFLGLDNAGKTTLLHMLKSEKIGTHQPTQHPNTEELTMGNISFKAIDLGGHELARRLWKDYFTNDVSAVVFLVDTADGSRFNEARRELTALLAEEDLQKTPFLILGNKIDKRGAVSEQELKHYLGLEGLTTGKENLKNNGQVRPLEVFMCSIVNGSGYGPGFRWLSEQF
jgi:GTP-binding protein SAR1